MVMPAKPEELHKLHNTKSEVVSERPSMIAGTHIGYRRRGT